MNAEPHGQQAILRAGTELSKAAGALILLHGRGGSAADILGLGESLSPAGWSLMAPQAAGHTWYPYSFLAPREENEPYLTSALQQVRSAVETALAAGIAGEKIVLAGFSQGACLATEFVGRNAARYGGMLAFTGGLIGPPGTPISLAGDLAGTPVLLSSGDPDPHVPWDRVAESAELLRQIGGKVQLKRYPGRPHTVSADEMDVARELLSTV